ncbi:hypothetical protein, partial [Mycobacterium kiyosense]
PTTPTQPRTAIARAEHHLATTNNPSGARTQAAELLTRRNELLEHLRDVDSTQAQLDAVTRRGQIRDRDNSHGIER